MKCASGRIERSRLPEFLERALAKAAAKKGKKGRAADRYIYGTMNKIGAMHGSKVTAKGRAMQKKHDAGH
jgi:hypothetical protein